MDKLENKSYRYTGTLGETTEIEREGDNCCSMKDLRNFKSECVTHASVLHRSNNSVMHPVPAFCLKIEKNILGCRKRDDLDCRGRISQVKI